MVRGTRITAPELACQDEVSGILPVDKPCGPTSHDVVDAVRRRLGIKRVGHTGTLDPFASGVLVLCVGRATRLARFIAGSDKEYTARVVLGEQTDTLDPTGEITAKCDCSNLSREDMRAAVAQFVGEFEQTPPAFSAVKIGGERAYSLARRGEEFERSRRKVGVSSIDLVAFEAGAVARADLRIECSSGFYVRALGRDLGLALSCPAMVAELRRLRVGSFAIESSLALSDVRSGEEGRRQLLGMEAGLQRLPKVEVTRADAGRLCAGQKVRCEGVPEGAEVAVLTDGRLIAVARAQGSWLQPKVVLRGRS